MVNILECCCQTCQANNGNDPGIYFLAFLGFISFLYFLAKFIEKYFVTHYPLRKID